MNFLEVMKANMRRPALDFAPQSTRVLSNQLEAAGLDFRATGGCDMGRLGIGQRSVAAH